jgi:hypothetical protein
MTVFQPVPNTIQCDAIFLLFGQRVENVYHVEVPGGIDAPAIADTANVVRDWVITSLLPQLSHNITFIGVEAKNLSIEDGGVHFSAPATTAVGGSSDSSMPGGTAFCVTLATASAGRSFRGRKYVPGILVSQVSGNDVLAAYGNALVAIFNTLIATLEAVDKILVIVSRIQDHAVLTTAVTTPVTTAKATDYHIDSQRRRLTGRGT